MIILGQRYIMANIYKYRDVLSVIVLILGDRPNRKLRNLQIFQFVKDVETEFFILIK